MRFLQVDSGTLPLSAVRFNECDIFVDIGNQRAEESAAGRSCFPFQFGHTGCVDRTHNRRSIVQSPAVSEQSGDVYIYYALLQARWLYWRRYITVRSPAWVFFGLSSRSRETTQSYCEKNASDHSS